MGGRTARTASYVTAVVLALSVVGISGSSAQADQTLFTSKSYPRVDGSVQTQPLGLAFQRGFTGEDLPSSDVVFTQTNTAYRNLIQGNADLILVESPSTSELAAQGAGVELEVIPVVDEGFVIMTNADNEVDSLTVTQLRDIYSGKITDWSEVGGPAGPITAYQHRADSGSQLGMLDLVMQGVPLANPPTVHVDTSTTAVDAVASFDGQAGGLGYSYNYYATAIWGDLTSPDSDDGIKLLRVNGVAPTAQTIQSGAYPLTTAYSIVIKKTETKNSPARRLADAMVSAYGQGLAQKAGYTPLYEAAITAQPPQSTLAETPGPDGLTSLDQRYQLNALVTSTTTDYVQAQSPDGAQHCASVQRLGLDGLADTGLQDGIVAEFTTRQDEFLMTTWGVQDLTYLDHPCEDSTVAGGSSPTAPEISMTVSVPANFSNVVSLVSSWSRPPSSEEAYDPAVTLNVRLDTGEELKVSDLFVAGANLAAMIQAEAAGSDPWAQEQTILEWVDDYAHDPQIPFSFSASEATVYLPGASSGLKTRLQIPYASRWHDLAVFSLASSATGVYAQEWTGATCPVLTVWHDGYCWDGEDRTVAQGQVSYQGDSLRIPLDFLDSDQWTVTGSSDHAVVEPPTAGTGPQTVTITVGENPSASPRLEWTSIEVTNTSTRLAYMGYVRIVQAGKAPPAAPEILSADAAAVTGTLDTPVEAGTVLIVTWPDATQSAPSTVEQDGTWSVTTPVSMASGTIRVVAHNGEGDSPVVTGALDTDHLVVDPRNSLRSITSAALTVTPGACSGDAVASPDVVTAGATIIDVWGRVVPGVTVVFSASDGLLMTQSGQTTDAKGEASMPFVVDAPAIAAGAQPSIQVTVVVDGRQINLGDPLVIPVSVLTPTSPVASPTATVFESEQPQPADGASAYTVSLQWSDSCGIPMADRQIGLGVDGSAKLSSSVVVLDGDGRATVSVTDNVAETVSVSAHVIGAVDSGDVAGLPVDLVFKLADPDPAQSSLTSAGGVVPIPCDGGGQTTLTAMVKNQMGLGLYGVEVLFTADGSAVIPASGTTDETGQVSVAISDAVAEAVHVSASVAVGGGVADLAGSPSVINFVPGCAPPDPRTVWYSLSDGPKAADGHDSYTLTIYARDLGGNPVAGISDQFTVGEDTGTVAIGDLSERSDGRYTATLTSDEAGSFPIHIQMQTSGTWRDLADSPATVTFVPAWSATMTAGLDVDPQHSYRAADDEDSYEISVRVSVTMGVASPAPLAGQASLLSVSLSPLDSGPDYSQSVHVTSFTEVSPGLYTAHVTSSATGNYRISVSWNEPGSTPVSSAGVVSFVSPDAVGLMGSQSSGSTGLLRSFLSLIAIVLKIGA